MDENLTEEERKRAWEEFEQDAGRPADAVAEPDGHSGSAESDVSRDQPRGGDGADEVDDHAVAAAVAAAAVAAAGCMEEGSAMVRQTEV